MWMIVKFNQKYINSNKVKIFQEYYINDSMIEYVVIISDVIRVILGWNILEVPHILIK